MKRADTEENRKTYSNIQRGQQALMEEENYHRGKRMGIGRSGGKCPERKIHSEESGVK